MDKAPRERDLDILLFDGVNLLDVAGPAEAFATARFNGKSVYRLRFLSMDGAEVTASCGMTLGVHGRAKNGSLENDLLVPGGDGVDGIAANEEVKVLLRARTGRLISICSGALALAAAGVLDGHDATTHWSRAAQLTRYPSVRWDLDRIFTRSGRVFTSAGVTTGVDLALAIIRKDCGSTVAMTVARELVVQMRRTGGQSQYAAHLSAQFHDNDLARLVESVIADPCRPWTLPNLAAEAGLHPRTLSRRFKRQHAETTPVNFVERIRVERARTLLEERHPIKTVATRSGFGDVQRLRRAFRRQLKTQPTDYEAAFADQGEWD